MRKVVLAISVLVLILFGVSPVLAATIRLDPHSSYYPDPIMLESPATFSVNVTAGGDPTSNPYIFLVMSQSSYDGLSLIEDTTVTWPSAISPVIIAKGDWIGPESDNSLGLPTGESVDSGTLYNVATLQDHLFKNDPPEEDIWWAFEPILDGADLTATPQDFTVTLPSSAPRMLVYVLGEYGETESFNNRVPPTQPGLVIPEVGTLILMASSFGGLIALYALKRKRIK
jgi:hypothetical protein